MTDGGWDLCNLRKFYIYIEYSVFTLRNASNPYSENIYLRFDRRPSAETLDTKKEEVIVTPDAYSVRNIFYIC